MISKGNILAMYIFGWRGCNFSKKSAKQFASFLHITIHATLISSNFFNGPFLAGLISVSLGTSIQYLLMAPVRVSKPPRVQERALALNDESQVEEPSRPGSQSSDDDQVAKLATRMQREVFLCSSLGK